MIVSVDPGTHEAGVAQWEASRLRSAYLVRADGWLDVADKVARSCSLPVEVLVLERPQVYVHSRAKGDPNDLITLALAAGAIAGKIGAEVVEFRPYEWKGQVPKPVMTKRIKQVLGAEELAVVEIPRAKSLAHNVWDAVGIGLHYYRRQYGGQAL